MEGPFLERLTQQIRAMGVTEEMLEIAIRPPKYSDDDPRIIELSYPSLFTSGYLKRKVELEIGARSLREPFSSKPIAAIIDQKLPQVNSGIAAFEVPTVNPDRTFLEKIFLLHEELTKAPEKIRHFRMSRHLYDLFYLADSDFGQSAIQNADLFETIRQHRQLYNEHDHVKYDGLLLSHLQFIPPATVLAHWEDDYQRMHTSMLGNNPPTFPQLMGRLDQLKAQVIQQ